MKPAPPVMTMVPELDSGTLRILQREAEFLGERFHRRPAALPRPIGLEPEIADATTPRRDHAADGPVVGTLRMLLIEATDDVGRHADKRAKRRGGPDRVLAAVPGRVEDDGDLLEVVDEKLLRVFVRI